MSAESTVLFRPPKKRKIYRQRDISPDPSAPEPSTAQSIDKLVSPVSTCAENEEEGVVVPVSEIIRLRKNKKRVGGVEFKASRMGVRDEEGEEQAEGDTEREGADGQAQPGGLAPRKFAPQMGIVGEAVDRHMMAYIDSEIAKRCILESQNVESKMQPQAQSNSQTISPVQLPGGREGAGEKNQQKQPATLGKLQEIDLGDEARERNREETERARRRLDGETVVEEVKKTGKVRLGRDGKPWRGRKRRGSDDVKRDQLVEAVLRENRLEIYDEPIEELASVNDNQAADDRMAEAFRKEFMDAVSARQKKKAAPAPAPGRNAAAKKEEELLKGPKLGGSRSARAAMRENLLKAAKK